MFPFNISSNFKDINNRFSDGFRRYQEDVLTIKWFIKNDLKYKPFKEQNFTWLKQNFSCEQVMRNSI